MLDWLKSSESNSPDLLEIELHVHEVALRPMNHNIVLMNVVSLWSYFTTAHPLRETVRVWGVQDKGQIVQFRSQGLNLRSGLNVYWRHNRNQTNLLGNTWLLLCNTYLSSNTRHFCVYNIRRRCSKCLNRWFNCNQKSRFAQTASHCWSWSDIAGATLLELLLDVSLLWRQCLRNCSTHNAHPLGNIVDLRGWKKTTF